MAKLTIVVGMGGSGKTYFCRKIAGRRPFFESATLTKNDERRAGHRCLGELVARLLGRDEDCVMEEPRLTEPKFRNTFKDFCDRFLGGVKQEWIFFERDVVGCINNVFEDARSAQPKPGRLPALCNQIGVYRVPDPHEFPGYIEPHPVYRGHEPKFDDEDDALDWLRGKVATSDVDCHS